MANNKIIDNDFKVDDPQGFDEELERKLEQAKQRRIEAFTRDLEALMNKYKVKLHPQAIMTPDGVQWTINIVVQ